AAGYILKIPIGTRESMALAYAEAPTARPPAYRRYVARQGDTLVSVARRYHVSVQSLADANSMAQRAKLKRGTVILIPQKQPVQIAAKAASKGGKTKSAARAAKETKSAGEEPSSPRSYTVRGGDTLYQIALKHGTTVAILMSANSLGSATNIHPGDTIKIPAKTQ